MKKIIFFTFLLMLLATLSPAKKLADLPEVLTSPSIYVQNNRIYIGEEKTIHIYSLKDFKHLKQFGKEGEGPGEFKFFMELEALSQQLVVNTMGKAIIFLLEGVFLEEFRTPMSIRGICPVGNNFVGYASVIKKGKTQPRQTINFYDRKFNLLKTIHDGYLGQTVFFESGTKKKQDLFMVRDYVAFSIYKDRVFFGDTTKGFFCSVSDSSGKKLYDIKRKYEKLKISEDYKKKIMKIKQESPHWQRNKKLFNYLFPEYFPAFRAVRFSGDKIYFVTYTNESNRDEVVVTDLKGNFIKKTSIPSDPYNRDSWFSIYKNQVFYLMRVEDEEDELWELHAENLK
ncbi:hypothetical protein ACFLRB_04505 [Acidobacteriota bacterium]